MKRKILMSLLLTVCLLLCACAQQHNTPPAENPAPTNDAAQENQQTSPSDDIVTPPADDSPTQEFVVPDELTVELVVEWEDADALLSRLEDMGEMLRHALEEVGCPVERVTITISTAGGFTADALHQGGIDAAVLPAVDFVACGGAAGIAMSQEEISETVIALTLRHGQPDSTFCAAFYDALTATASGQEFLSLCRPSASFTVPTEEAMQAVLDWIAQQEQELNGGIGE